jgi:hypothetical protein
MGAGRTLTPAESSLARRVGVLKPQLIRIESCDQLPVPQDPALYAAAIQAGLVGPGMIGLTLGYAVFIRKGHETCRLLSHEFRHVQQYESHGSIARFLPIYLRQVISVGYRDAPLEVDARAHEIDAL